MPIDQSAIPAIETLSGNHTKATPHSDKRSAPDRSCRLEPDTIEGLRVAVVMLFTSLQEEVSL